MVKSFVTNKLDSLNRLARNVWCSWNHDARKLFKMINPDLWDECDKNPIALLNKLSYEELLELENNKDFLNQLQQVTAKLDDYEAKRKEKKELR